ncbi:MAG: 2-oxo acid dehydrogenase subunit E2 [Clostridia bacterium]|nr:2-oxo acid dehydrogenase subunit E2 [Clostridia bacterium]
MANAIIMPRQGQSVESCLIGKWHKHVGDSVAAGDLLFTYETDKATFDETAKDAGTLLAIFAAEGDDVPCLQNVCVIGQPGENFAQFDPRGSAAPAAETLAPATVAAAPGVPAPASGPAAPVAAASIAPVATPSGPAGTPVIMPRQGQSVESCLIGKWHKNVGDAVAEGDVLFTYETDKATFDETAKISGTMLAIFAAEGDDVPCLQNVCVIGQPGDSFAQFDPNGASAAAPVVETASAPAAAAPFAPAGSAGAISRSANASIGTDLPAGELPEKISPRARTLAEKSGADLRQASATGPQGRVIERDVAALIAAGKVSTGAVGTAFPAGLAGTGLGGAVSLADLSAPVAAPAALAAAPAPVVPTAAPAPAVAADETRVEKHSNIRKVIARSMQASLSQMAQLTLNTSFDATDMLALRTRLKQAGEKGLTAEMGFALAEKAPTINDLILFAVSRVLPRHPACNAHYDDEKMTYFSRVHLGVAVDTPRGLMVPTVFAADQMDLPTLATEVKAAAKACQTGTISPDALKGGTFTVTNLGSLGIETFTPVINPPQTCILGVNTIVTKVREVGGEVKAYQAIPLSLTFDHRALDGAPAARFLQDLVRTLENISLALMHG